MKIISEIRIDHFRSFKKDQISDLGDFTSFAGVNNSGKSNVLRAMHAFFTSNTDVDALLNVSDDYFKHDRRRQKRKISISLKFDLPKSFHFRKGLENIKTLLGGDSFLITKEWSLDNPMSLYYLNDSRTALGLDDKERVDKFLGLISFRYIPNRVLPLDIIRNEHKALRNVLIRRLASRGDSIFSEIKDTSRILINSLSKNIHDACPDIGDIRLDTPTSWQDMIFAFGYKLAVGKAEIPDIAQGSGIQSFLMLHTLALIDRDYFQQFGWRQAAIWAIEEPESSLHTSLEAQVASYLADLSNSNDNRLQIFSTTHSDLILQYSNKTIFVALDEGESKFEETEKERALKKSAASGITRWIEPLLCFPLDPLLLVEGKFDHDFIQRALEIIAPDLKIHVEYLEKLEGAKMVGGVDEIYEYLKRKINLIKVRCKDAPIIVLLDWDVATKRRSDFQKLMNRDIPLHVVYCDNTFNHNLGETFRGIERFMPDRIISEVETAYPDLFMQRRNGIKEVTKKDYERLKSIINQVVLSGILKNDLTHIEPVLNEVIQITNGQPRGAAPTRA